MVLPEHPADRTLRRRRSPPWNGQRRGRARPECRTARAGEELPRGVRGVVEARIIEKLERDRPDVSASAASSPSNSWINGSRPSASASTPTCRSCSRRHRSLMPGVHGPSGCRSTWSCRRRGGHLLEVLHRLEAGGSMGGRARTAYRHVIRAATGRPQQRAPDVRCRRASTGSMRFRGRSARVARGRGLQAPPRRPPELADEVGRRRSVAPGSVLRSMIASHGCRTLRAHVIYCYAANWETIASAASRSVDEMEFSSGGYGVVSSLDDLL